MELKSQTTVTPIHTEQQNDPTLHCPLCNSKTEQQFVVVESLLAIKEKAVCPSCKVPVRSTEHILH